MYACMHILINRSFASIPWVAMSKTAAAAYVTKFQKRFLDAGLGSRLEEFAH